MIVRQEEIYHFSITCPKAQQVFLMGDFNKWSSTAAPMERDDAGRWQLGVRLSPGNYRFAYFILHEPGFAENGLPWRSSLRSEAEGAALRVSGAIDV